MSELVGSGLPTADVSLRLRVVISRTRLSISMLVVLLLLLILRRRRRRLLQRTCLCLVARKVPDGEPSCRRTLIVMWFRTARGNRVGGAVRRRCTQGGDRIKRWEKPKCEPTSTGRCLGVEHRATGRVVSDGRARRHGVPSFNAEVGGWKDCFQKGGRQSFSGVGAF